MKNVRRFAVLLALLSTACVKEPVSLTTEAAIEALREPASHGDAEAQSQICTLYLMEHAYHSAFRWCQEASRSGDATAQYNFGTMLDNGDGFSFRLHRRTEAAYHYQKAAMQGHHKAQFSLGNLFERGEGLPRSAYSAYIWYSLAANAIPEAETHRRQLMSSLSAEERRHAATAISNWERRIAAARHARTTSR